MSNQSDSAAGGARLLLSGNEAIARAGVDAQVALGAGYPGTPSTEILENFSDLGGPAQWSPNEKVALEVAIGAAYGGARVLMTTKHVGLNVAADPLFTVAYTGVAGALVIVVADDPGMASSQNEQDSRRYARAAGVPMFEPADSQEAYDMTLEALRRSQEWGLPVFLRVTTRVCHSKTIVTPHGRIDAPTPTHFERDIPGLVMIPAYARIAHKKLREQLAAISEWADTTEWNGLSGSGGPSLGVITSGIVYQHVRDAAPEADVLKLGFSYPVPEGKIRDFVTTHERCVVIEEGDPVLAEAIGAMGLTVESKSERYRFGELSVERIRRILDRDESPEPSMPKGKPPQLCVGCPHRKTFEILKELNCIVTGDIGCYTLGVLPPFQAMDTCVCMGASIGVGLGLRHVIPEDEARRVVSVIGDSTFVHSGVTGLIEMAYNRPRTGHLTIILDNGTTAMTGMQEHPGTGRRLNHDPAYQLVIEDVCRAVGIERTFVIDPVKAVDELKDRIAESLKSDALSVIIVRRPCILALAKIKKIDTANGEPKG